MPETILVTGASGFVGGHLLPALRAAFPAAQVVGTAQETMDITNPGEVLRVMADLKPDVCIHLAGIASIGAAVADEARCWAVNLHGSLNVADAIKAEAPGCRMIFISSSEVYGASFKAGLALSERAVLAPMNLYAASKAAADLALGARVAQGLRLLRLRPFNHTGPGQSEAFVVPAFAGQIARIEAGLAPPVISVGALEPERDFLDIRDVCAAYVACVKNDAKLGPDVVLNIASGRGVKIATVLETLLAQSRCSIAVEQDAARLRPAEIMTAVGDATSAAERLGWQPECPLGETLERVLDFARQGVSGV